MAKIGEKEAQRMALRRLHLRDVTPRPEAKERATLNRGAADVGHPPELPAVAQGRDVPLEAPVGPVGTDRPERFDRLKYQREYMREWRKRKKVESP